MFFFFFFHINDIILFFFFFQAEDGIRDHCVTGVQTCALPIWPGAPARGDLPARVGLRDGPRRPLRRRVRAQAAPEARARLAALALSPHPLRNRLPLCGRVARPAGADGGAAAARDGRGGGARLSCAAWARTAPSTFATSSSSSASRWRCGCCRGATPARRPSTTS